MTSCLSALLRAFCVVFALAMLHACGGGQPEAEVKRRPVSVILSAAGAQMSQAELSSALEPLGIYPIDIQIRDAHVILYVHLTDATPSDWRQSLLELPFINSRDTIEAWNSSITQPTATNNTTEDRNTVRQVKSLAAGEYYSYVSFDISFFALGCADPLQISPTDAINACNEKLQNSGYSHYRVTNLRKTGNGTFNGVDYQFEVDREYSYTQNNWTKDATLRVVVGSIKPGITWAQILNTTDPVLQNQFTCPHGGTPQRERVSGEHREVVCTGGNPPSNVSQPPEIPAANACQAGQSTGNPIIPASGEKVFRQTDVTDQAPHPLTFERTYRTQWQIAPQAQMSTQWGHNHSANLRLDPADAGDNTLILQLPDGTQRRFARTNSTAAWTNGSHADQLVAAVTSGGAAAWRYIRRADDSQWLFTQPTASTVGQLQSQRQRDGWTYTYAYNAAGRLEQVRNQFNRTLGLSYHPSGLLASVTGPDGKVTGYTWDASSRLARVIFPDANYIEYHYEDSRFPQYITGITDENGKRYQSVSYDSLGRAEVSTLAGNADKYTVSYGNSTGGLNTGATITDPIGTARSFGYAQTNGHTDVTLGSNLPGCKGEPPIATRSQNPLSGLLEREVDFKGNVTQYTWDGTRQLIRSVTRAAGTPQQQVTAIDWHPSLTLPVLVTEPLKKTQYDYDADGRLQKISVTHTGGQTPDKVQTTQYTYTSAGLLETRTEPNGAMTRYANHNAAGLPQTVTNAIGHVTTVAYDAMGRPTSITQPDGLVRTLDYENRGWLKLSSETANGLTLTTQYTYTPSGQVKTITRPNGHVITYEHDDAQRVTGWSDNRGQSATYTLDGLGNITAEQIRNSGGATALQIGRSINAINRLASQTLGGSVMTAYGYDANGRLETINDAANHTTALGRDALARVSSITDALGRVAQLGYNGQDALISASDFKGVATTFAPDAQGQPAAETSPDAGSRSATFDALSLPTSVTDALGRATNITRDPLGRPTLIAHSQSGEPTLTTELRYDLPGTACNASGHPNASKGRLCEVIHKEGGETQATTQYQWDAFGRQTRQTQILSSAVADHSTVLNTAYSYVVSGAGAGELASISYPSGSVLTHQYSAAGQLSGLLWNGQPLLENIRFNALGQPLSWTWAFADSSSTTNLGASRTYNTAGQLISSEFASYVPNTLGQIEGMTQGLYRPDGAGGWVLESVPMTAVYNEVGQLTGFAAAGTSASTQRSHGYGYDTNGNRVSNYQSGPAGTNQTTTSTIASDSNRLSQHAGQEVQTNAAGEIERLDNKALRYDAAGRLTALESFCNTTASNRLRCPMMVIPPTLNRYNGLNQRVQRDNSRQHSVYVYGQEAHAVLAEIHRDLRTSVLSTTEHVYLPTASGAMPVAAVINGIHYAVHSDHLNTPRRLTDASGQAKWQWAYSGFGEVAAQSLPARSQAPLSYSLRYPGQVDDGNGLFYNFHRFYHPRTGRYTQVDPIGLEGGWNRFGYVNGNPVSFVDPMGLFNLTKGASALGNATMAGFAAGSGGIKLAIAIGISPATATGVGALPPLALASWSAWNFKSSAAAWSRARQQWGEAMCEKWSDANWKNFWGLAPGGTHYDDPGEPNGPLKYIETKGWWRFISEAGVF